MSVSEAVRDLVDDIVESTELATRNGFHLEPRCRVCRNDQVREKVNHLLASGSSYAQIVRALAADNAELDKCDRVTIDSVRNHTVRHFPVQQTAHATYRTIPVSPSVPLPRRTFPNSGPPSPPPRSPRRPDLRIARPQGRNDDHRRHGDLRLRPNRPGPNRTERSLENSRVSKLRVGVTMNADGPS